MVPLSRYLVLTRPPNCPNKVNDYSNRMAMFITTMKLVLEPTSFSIRLPMLALVPSLSSATDPSMQPTSANRMKLQNTAMARLTTSTWPTSAKSTFHKFFRIQQLFSTMTILHALTEIPDVPLSKSWRRQALSRGTIDAT